MHPAIVFLLLLAIADDAGGLIVLASFYPQEVHNLFLFLQGFNLMLEFVTGVAVAILLSLLFWKVLKITNFWLYLIIPGIISWISFHEGGIHPACGHARQLPEGVRQDPEVVRGESELVVRPAGNTDPLGTATQPAVAPSSVCNSSIQASAKTKLKSSSTPPVLPP